MNRIQLRNAHFFGKYLMRITIMKIWPLYHFWPFWVIFLIFIFIFYIAIFFVFGKLIESQNFKYKFHLKYDTKIFYLRCRRSLYGQLALKCARLKFCENLYSISAIKYIFSLNESFFQDHSFEDLMNFVPDEFFCAPSH